MHWDVWSARGAASFNTTGFVHDRVNHSLNFVDPTTGVHAQNVQCMWSKAKKKQKQGHGTSDSIFSSYLQEYLWRRKYGLSPFENIISHIAEVYRE